MRILHCADIHIGDSQNIPHNLERQFAAWDEIYRIADKNKCKYVLVAGDLVDSTTISEKARAWLNRKILEVHAAYPKITTILISGNHDVYISTQSMLRIFKDTSDNFLDRFYIVELKPKLLELGNLSVFCIPYKKGLTTKKLRSMIHKAHAKHKGKYFVVMAHFYAQGAVLDNGYDKGGDVKIGEPVWDYFALGDIHKRQKMGKMCYYSGSPIQHTFGDKLPKGVIIVDLKQHKVKKVNIESSNIPRLVTLKEVPEKWPENAYVRLKAKKDISGETLPDSVIQASVVNTSGKVLTAKLGNIFEGLPELLADIGFSIKEQKQAVRIVTRMVKTLDTEE